MSGKNRIFGDESLFIKILLMEKDETLGIPFWILETTQKGIDNLENEIKDLIGVERYNRVFDFIFVEKTDDYVDQILYMQEHLDEANLEIIKTYDLTETFRYILENPEYI